MLCEHHMPAALIRASWTSIAPWGWYRGEWCRGGIAPWGDGTVLDGAVADCAAGDGTVPDGAVADRALWLGPVTSGPTRIVLMMIENHRSGLIWRLLRNQSANLQRFASRRLSWRLVVGKSAALRDDARPRRGVMTTVYDAAGACNG
jgi:hypothetical protein